MLLFILAIVVLLGGVVAYLFTRRGVVAAIALVIAAALCVFSCVATVPTGHTGVVTTFGFTETPGAVVILYLNVTVFFGLSSNCGQ